MARHARGRRSRAIATLLGSAMLAAPVACAGKGAGPSSSQEPAPAKFAFKPLPCDSLPAPRDSVDESVYLGVQAPVHDRPLPPGFLDAVLDAVRQAFQPPQPIAMPVFVGVGDTATAAQSPRLTALRPGLAAEVEFTLGDAGAVVGHVTTSSLSPALDSALVHAPARADSLHLLPQSFGPGGLGEPVKFFVTLLTSRPNGSPWAPLFLVRVPEWRGAQEARPLVPDATASPPVTAIHGRVHNEWVVFQVVIDEYGRAMPSTMRLISAHYREFARAAAGRVETTAYRAASIGGCAVKGIAELRYSFAVAE